MDAVQTKKVLAFWLDVNYLLIYTSGSWNQLSSFGVKLDL
jgi:hypothetical protein